MPTKDELRQIVRTNLDAIVQSINAALRGEQLDMLEPVLQRSGSGGQLPHWYLGLKTAHSLPNLDGKTIGSVVEMLLVAVLETTTLAGLGLPPLTIKPARGVDLPDLDLGVKSPSENYCTSEPFYSPYERLLGSEFDALVFLTDYQTAKSTPPLKLQILKCNYLTKTEVADQNLCALARRQRAWLVAENEARAKKFIRFLAYVNQKDWRAKQLLRLLQSLHNDADLRAELARIKTAFTRENGRRTAPPKRSKKAWKPREPIPLADMEALEAIEPIRPLAIGVIDAVDNWIVEQYADAARLPNENEWQRLLVSPLDGKIGMSVALQWRYNFGRLFKSGRKKGQTRPKSN